MMIDLEALKWNQKVKLFEKDQNAAYLLGYHVHKF
jgi:hypothetical protein